MSKKLTQEQYLTSVVEKHGDRFDLSEVCYTRGKNKVIVTCKKHNYRFEITAYRLLAGKECCRLCANENISQSRIKPLHEWLAVFNDKYGDKFIYDESTYVDGRSHMSIYCVEHDKHFLQSPANHAKTSGCSLCITTARQRSKRHTLEMFLDKTRLLKLDVYDYSKVVYKTTHSHIVVGCPWHGDFVTTPSAILSNKKCPTCATERLARLNSMGLDRFIELASSFHNNKYSYHMSSYLNQHTPICIWCPEHGPFAQLPMVHLRSGCPSCGEYGFDKNQSAVLYVLSVDGIFNFTGFGITKDSETRLSRHTKSIRDAGCFVQDTYISEVVSGDTVLQLETLLKQTFPLAACSRDIPGFKTESTTADYATVVAFVEDYITKNK